MKMPARRGRSAPKPLTLGFIGSAEIDSKAIIAALDDLITEDTEVEMVAIPVTKDTFTEEMSTVVAWFKKYDIPYVTLSDEEAQKDRALKKVIAGGTDDYDIEAQDTPALAVIELIKGDEKEPSEDARLLILLDPETDDDVKAAEAADEAEVPAYNMAENLSLITFADDDTDGPAEEEPEDEEPPARRGRRGAAKETEEEEKPTRGRRGSTAAKEEPEEDGGDDADEVVLTAAEKRRRTILLKLGLTELKKKLKDTDEKVTTNDLKGLDKEDVADQIIAAERRAKEDQLPLEEEPADEAQNTTSRGRAKKAEPGDEPADEDEQEDPKELVFGRLRANREAAERISVGLVQALKAINEQGDEDQAQERAAAAVAVSLMLFAEYIVTEVRKPKSAGRPRRDGTEAQSRKAAEETEEETPKPTRGRRRSS